MRKPITICLTLFIMLAGARSAAATSVEEAYRYMEQGNAYHKEGNFKKAALKYKAAWEGGKLLDACFNLALTYDRDLNENELAVKYYSEFLAADAYAPEAEEIRKLIDKARKEVSQAKWWLDAQRQAKVTKPTEALLARVKEYQKKDAIAQEEGREEDSYPGQAHICLGCHAGAMGPQVKMSSTHPVGRVPTGVLAQTVPKYVRYYKEGQVLCLSCHNQENIHFEAGTEGINYKYLRIDTEGGENLSRFCAFCHSSKASGRDRDMDDDGGRDRLDIRE